MPFKPGSPAGPRSPSLPESPGGPLGPGVPIPGRPGEPLSPLAPAIPVVNQTNRMHTFQQSTSYLQKSRMVGPTITLSEHVKYSMKQYRTKKRQILIKIFLSPLVKQLVEG